MNDPEIEIARGNVCISKQQTCYDKENDKCRMCGCQILKSKVFAKTSVNLTYLQTEETHCPKGLWPIRDDDGKITGKTDVHIANFWLKKRGKTLINI